MASRRFSALTAIEFINGFIGILTHVPWGEFQIKFTKNESFVSVSDEYVKLCAKIEAEGRVIGVQAILRKSDGFLLPATHRSPPRALKP
jgi:hypothetical protein